MPRATYVAVLTIGLFYTVTTYLMVEGQGAAGLKDHLGGLTPDPTAFLFELGGTYFGTVLTVVMSLLFVSSVFAALLAFHNAVARYLFALGREGLLPKQMGRTHSVHLSPHIGSLTQTTLAVVVVLIFVVTGQDPVLALFTWLTQLGTLAIIALMSLASFAVVAFFAKHREFDSNLLRTLVAPIIGGFALAAVAIFAAASQFGLLIGNPDSPLRWILPALIVVAAVVGVSHRVHAETPLAGVVRADGSASRHRIRPRPAEECKSGAIRRGRRVGRGLEPRPVMRAPAATRSKKASTSR